MESNNPIFGANEDENVQDPSEKNPEEKTEPENTETERVIIKPASEKTVDAPVVGNPSETWIEKEITKGLRVKVPVHDIAQAKQIIEQALKNHLEINSFLDQKKKELNAQKYNVIQDGVKIVDSSSEEGRAIEEQRQEEDFNRPQLSFS